MEVTEVRGVGAGRGWIIEGGCSRESGDDRGERNVGLTVVTSHPDVS